MFDRRIEVDFYEEIGRAIKDNILGNISNPNNYEVKILLHEIKAALGTLIIEDKLEYPEIRKYASELERLDLDISVLVVNKSSGKFEIIILEVKKMSAVGLTQFSQLVGYCLVSGTKFGVLVNVDGGVSDRFSVRLDTDKDLTTIERIYHDKKIIHKFGVINWDSEAQQFIYTNRGSIKSVPQLVELVIGEIG